MPLLTPNKKKTPKWEYKTPKISTFLSATAIEHNIVFSKTDAWAVYQIPSVSYEFLNSTNRVMLANDYSQTIENLIQSEDKPVECHQIVTSRPFDVLGWGNALYARAQKWNPEPGFAKHLHEQMRHVNSRQFSVKEVFYLIHLGKRTKDFTLNTSGLTTIQQVARWIDRIAPINDPLVSDKELEFWRAKERDYAHTIQTSRISGKRANSAQVAWLIKKNLFPGMKVPPVSASPHRSWGYGEMQSLVTGIVDPGRRFLKISQFDPETGEEVTGYRATLSFSRFPDVLKFPDDEPWIHSAAVLPFDVDIHSRFTVEPALKVKKEVGRKIKDAKDQLQNASGSGQGTPLEMQEQYEVATQLEYDLNRERKPWIYARHRIVIEALSEEELIANAQQTIEHYKGMGITVVWPTADQFSLFLESMPADKVRDHAFHQRHQLDIIGGGMPHGSGTVGDQVVHAEDGETKGYIGQYLGYTTSRVQEIVCVSVHSAIARNNAPGLAITGSPGGGKSFSAFTITYQMALEGVWVIYLDPKADAKPMAALPGLRTPKLFDLAQGNEGLLDPFSIGKTVSERQLLALETIRLLTGHLSDEQQGELVETVKTVARMENPSLNAVVDMLYSAKKGTPAHTLGGNLDFIRELPFAKLCFSPQGSVNLRPDEGLTVVTLLGLDLPSAEMKSEAYSYPNRLAVAVMFLLTSFTRQLMLNLNKRHPKAIVIDEAWAITSTNQGASLIQLVARMGRSHNTALVLVSQNAGDLLSEGITNSVSMKMAYRANVQSEVSNVLDFLDIQKDAGIEQIVQQLENGECLMKDADGRIARMKVDAWNKEMKTAFDTNPETRNSKNSGI